MQIPGTNLSQEKSSALIDQEPESPSKKSATKSFSKILEEKTKPEKAKHSSEEKEKPGDKHEQLKKELGKKVGESHGELASLFQYLYDLVYRDPSTWSIADREHYGLEKGNLSLQDFHKMLSARGMMLQDFSFDHLTQMTHLNNRRQLSTFLDKLSREMQFGIQQPLPDEQKPFSRIKTSLQELERSRGTRENQILKEMIKQISLRKIQQGTEVKITMNPKELGEVNLGLILGENGITAQFKTTSSSVKEVLEANLDELSKALLKQGLKVHGLEVQKVSQKEE